MEYPDLFGTRNATSKSVNTTLAIPIWNDRVSTTFDFAQTLLVVEVSGEREISRKTIVLKDEPAERKAHEIRDMGVQVVLCGALSRPLAQAVTQRGIEIIPYVTGHVDDVLAVYLCGRLTEPLFLQPGCRPGARRRWRHRGGFCRGGKGCQ